MIARTTHTDIQHYDTHMFTLRHHSNILIIHTFPPPGPFFQLFYCYNEILSEIQV